MARISRFCQTIILFFERPVCYLLTQYQRASADKLRAAIDVGWKQLSPNNKCHVIFIVFSKFYIKSAGGDGKFVVINKFRAFWCIICLCSCSEQKGHQFFLKGSHGRTVTSSAIYPLSLIPLATVHCTAVWEGTVTKYVLKMLHNQHNNLGYVGKKTLLDL